MAPTQKLLRRAGLLKLLRTINSATPVGITSLTDPGLRKTGNPFRGNVVKLTRASGLIGWGNSAGESQSPYAQSVNRQRLRENKLADFKAKPRTWGTRLKGTPLVEHVPEGVGNVLYYLELKRQSDWQFFFRIDTGERIDRRELEPWIPARHKNHRQGVQTEITLRDYRLDHIAELRMGGEQYQISEHIADLSRFEVPTPGRAAARD